MCITEAQEERALRSRKWSVTKPQRGPAGPRGKHPLTQEGSGDKNRFRETRPTEAREEMQIRGRCELLCVWLGEAAARRSCRALKQVSTCRGGPELSGRKGVGWVPGTFTGAGAGLSDPPHPFRPQWEARSPSCTPGRVSPAAPQVPPLPPPHRAPAPALLRAHL